jgi:hypothetical protein
MKKLKVTISITVILFLLFTFAGSNEAGGATISGTVAVCKSNSDTYVLLCKSSNPSDPEPVCKLDSKLTAMTNKAGEFTFEKVKPGIYVVIYALPLERKGTPKQWDKIEVHYRWPLFGSPINELDTSMTASVQKKEYRGIILFSLKEGLDPFGGKEGILTSMIPGGFPPAKGMKQEGTYKGRKAVYFYPYSSVVISKQYGLSIEYKKGKPQTISVTPGQKLDLIID